MATTRVAGSFRDPSGHLFQHGGQIYRRVNSVYREHFDLMMSSGFYEAATGDGSLLPHQELPPSAVPAHSDAYKLLLPEQLSFISYPYEWSFSQLRDAALLTLGLQRRALEFGLSLKDASAYNVQFRRGRPVFIDSLSFERYPKGRPWVAYRQFCSHFLAPLALASYGHPDLIRYLRLAIDGIPLDLASSLLPVRSRFRLGLLIHLHLHARSQRKHGGRADSAQKAKTRRVSKAGLVGIVSNLETSIRKLRYEPDASEWGAYYEDTNYSEAADTHKQELVMSFLEELEPTCLWDVGANTGRFSRLATHRGISTVASDSDSAAVEKNYLDSRDRGDTHMLPLVMDLTNPSPGIGWAGEERMSLAERGPADALLALALVHHLAISNNLPLPRIAEYLHSLCRALIIEFVPKSDSQVERLLQTREDIFPDYTVEGFEAAFSEHFQVRRRERIRDSERVLYLLDPR